MNTQLYLTLAASAVFLGLAALSAIRGTKSSPLTMPTALLCVDLFAYNGLEVLGNLTSSAHWEWLESAAAALAVPLLFHLTLAFLGARRAHRSLLIATYAFFGAVVLSCLAPFANDAWGSYPGGDHWALLMLLGIAPAFVFACVILVRHYRESRSAEERARTQLFIVTVAILVGGVSTDLAVIAGATYVPQLASGSMLLSAILLTALALRARLLSGALTTLFVTAVLVGVIGVVAQSLVFYWLGELILGLTTGTVIVTLLLLFAARLIWSAHTEVRARTAHLATLGRLSAQMAHDIRNPLAAIRGAAQYLAEERRRGNSLEDQGEFIDLILDQTERIDRVVGDYRRLGGATPEPVETDVDALLAGVATGAALSVRSDEATVEVRCEASNIGTWHLDPELVTTALENLIRNSVEALEDDRGTITLDARRTEETLSIEVTDDGPGMDARTREQAEEAFFTTKAQGSGLGLAFARRVAEAHGGQLKIRSALGRGTTVELTLGKTP